MSNEHLDIPDYHCQLSCVECQANLPELPPPMETNYTPLTEEQRNQLYSYVIDGWRNMNRNAKKSAKFRFKKALGEHGVSLEEAWSEWGIRDLKNLYNSNDSLDTLKVSVCPTPSFSANGADEDEQEEEEENNMDIAISNTSNDYDKRCHLRSRFYDVRSTKMNDLQRVFGLVNDQAPKTFAEAMERVKAGLYVLPEKKQDPDCYMWYSQVQWRDPSVKADRDGFEKAKELLYKDCIPVEDAIAINSPEEALVALQAWEAASLPTLN